jgi:hypothetical protein
MTVPLIIFAVFLAFLVRDIVKKEVRHIEDLPTIIQAERRDVYNQDFQDPYLEYDVLDLLEQEENNSIVEGLIKPCDTKVDRSS